MKLLLGHIFAYSFLLSTIVISGCNDYKDLEHRIEVLEAQCQQLNNDIQNLQKIVAAVEKKVYVAAVEENSTGYDIRLSDGSILHIRHGKNGSNGSSTTIGIKSDDKGVYYWTVFVDGIENWMLDGEGNKVAVTGHDGKEGITPLVRIDENGYWTVSYDNGTTYTFLLNKKGEKISARGDAGDSFFQSISEDDHFVYFTLTDNTIIKLPKQRSLSIAFDLDDELAVYPGSVTVLNYTVTGATDATLVKAFGQNGWSAKVIPTNISTGLIRICAPENIVEDEIIVLVYDGVATTIMATVNCIKGVIEMQDNYLDVPVEGGQISVTLTTNINYKVSIPKTDWIALPKKETRALRKDVMTFDFSKNIGTTRYASIELQDEEGKVLQRIGVSQAGERTDFAALKAMFDNLNGSSWNRNENWGSDVNLKTWYGITTEKGRVVSIALDANNLSGSIPEEISELNCLRELNLFGNNITGELPSSFANLTKLATFNCRYNSMDFSAMPSGIKSHPHFTSWKLLPQSDTSKTEIYNSLMLFYEATNGDNWFKNENWGSDEDFSKWYGLSVYNGNITKMDLHSNNLSGHVPEVLTKVNTLKSILLYDNNLEGEIPQFFSSFPDLTTLYLRNNYFETTSFKVPDSHIERVSRLYVCLPQKNENFRLFVDSDIDGSGSLHADGSYNLYQKAQVGQGIDLFIIGEGFDAQENTKGGTLDYWMQRAAEAAFSVDPMNKLRRYYNVYFIYAHSPEKGVSIAGNIRKSKFGYTQKDPLLNSSASINTKECREFIRQATGRTMENSNVIVLINSTHNALFGGISLHSSKPSISYALIPIRSSAIKWLVWHECVGHGIGRLGDEYTKDNTPYNGTLDDVIAQNANLDTEADPARVKWAAFIGDSRYYDESIGIYEGGKNFSTGVYRATRSSIMRNSGDTTQRFNAPSRAQIYRQTLNLAFPDWEFDYETFVAFDLNHTN